MMTYRELLSRLTDLRMLMHKSSPNEHSGCMSSYDRASRFDESTGTYINWDANDDGSGCIRTLPDGNAAFHIKGFYDRYTQYRRDHAIIGECLPYSQFIKQLRKSDLFVEAKTIRFSEDTKHAMILNYPLLRSRCDIDGFLQSQVEPLTGS